VGDQEEELTSRRQPRPLECVAFMLIAGGRVLAEQRELTKETVAEDVRVFRAV
jgi:hypothetical protein